MKVKMTVHISGLRDGVPWPEIGDSIDVPEREGSALIAAGVAEMDQSIEVAAFAPPETAMLDRPKPRKPGRPRKEVFPPKEA